MLEKIDHTQKVESRLAELVVKPQDVCAFFKKKDGRLVNLKQCIYCTYGVFDNEICTIHKLGLCRIKR